MRYLTSALYALVFMSMSTLGWAEDYDAGNEAFNVGDYETAHAIWQPLADAGDADSQFGMGMLYANGFGVAMDDTLALSYYGKAAEQGHGQALCNLGTMHANGWGVPQSDEEAFKYYAQAAELGITEAQANLSSMYARGYGTEQDIVQAHMWMSIAAGLNHSGAEYKLEQLANDMTEEQIAEGATLATAWLDAHPDIVAACLAPEE